MYDQAVGDTMTEYDAALHKLASNRHFSMNQEELSSIHNQFGVACAMRQSSNGYSPIQICPTRKQWILHVLSMEAADKNARMIRPTTASIHSTKTKDSRLCYCCGCSAHNPANCKFKDTECHRCHKRATSHPHAEVRPKPSVSRTQHPLNPRNIAGAIQISCGRTNSLVIRERAVARNIDSTRSTHVHHAIEVDVLVCGTKLTMEVDAGAAVSIISESTTVTPVLLPQVPLHKLDLVLKTYPDEHMAVLSTLKVKVQYRDQLESFILVVVSAPASLVKTGSSTFASTGLILPTFTLPGSTH